VKFWTSDPKCPSPKTPLQGKFLTPHTNKKGVNLLIIYAAICLYSSHAIDLIPEELKGKNWFAH
jgi:hypothetical protein